MDTSISMINSEGRLEVASQRDTSGMPPNEKGYIKRTPKAVSANILPTVLQGCHRPHSGVSVLDNTSIICSKNSPSLRPSPGNLPGSRKRRAFGSNGPLCDTRAQEQDGSTQSAFVDKNLETRMLPSQHMSHQTQPELQQTRIFLPVPSTPIRPFFDGSSPILGEPKTPSTKTPSPSPTIEKLAIFEKLAIQSSPIIVNSPGSSFTVVSKNNSLTGDECTATVPHPRGAHLPLRRKSASPRHVPLTVLSSSSSRKSCMPPQSPSLKPREDISSVPFFPDAQSAQKSYLSPRWKRRDTLSSEDARLLEYSTRLCMESEKSSRVVNHVRQSPKANTSPPVTCDTRFKESKPSPQELDLPLEVDCRRGSHIRGNCTYNQPMSLFNSSPGKDPRNELTTFVNISGCDDDSLTDSDNDGDWFFLETPGGSSTMKNKYSGPEKKSRQMTSSTTTASTAATTSTITTTSKHLPALDLPFASKPMMMPSSFPRKDALLPIINPPQITSTCSGSRLSSCNSLFGMSIIHEKTPALDASANHQDSSSCTFGSAGFPSIGTSTVKRTSSESSFGFSSKRTSSDISLGLGLEKAPYLTECGSRDMITPPVISSVPQNPPPMRQRKFTIL